MENGQRGNVTRLTQDDKPKIVVKMPSIKDASNFVGAIAIADASGMLEALERDFKEAAFAVALKDALRSPAAREELLYVLADLWIYDPPESVLKSEEPPDEWDYDPPPEVLKANPGMMGRDERWRAMSKRQKKRMVKKMELEERDITDLKEFVEAFRRLPLVEDFIKPREKSSEEDSGESTTPSPEDTDGEGSESPNSPAHTSAESSNS